MPPELNNSTEIQEISDEQKFFNLLDSGDTATDEDERAEEVAESTEEVDEDVDATDDYEDEYEVEDERSEQDPEDDDTEYVEEGDDTGDNQDGPTDGELRLADYTQKTQLVAEERKELEREKAQISLERQQLLAMLQKQQTSNNGELDKFNNVDWAELKEYEPDKYLMMREEQREAVTNIQTQQQEQDRLAQAQQQDFGVQMQRYLAEEDAKLVDQIEGWSNPEAKKAVQNDIAAYAKTMGYSDEELGSLADSRALVLMHKARLYDQMQGSGKDLVTKKKAKAVRRVVSGGKPVTSAQKDSKRAAELRSRAKKSGSVDDAAAAFMDMF
jgi:hypothetical protein